MTEFFLFLFASFNPRYYYGKKIYINDLKNLSENYWKRFLQTSTLKVDENWLGVSNPDSTYRWRWIVVENIRVTESFIFIYLGMGSLISIPKRAFPSVESFQEFGKKLSTFYENKKNQPIRMDVEVIN